MIISDGKIRKNNLKNAGYDEKWLRNKLKKYNITDYSKIIFLSVTDEKEIVIQIAE